MNIKKNMWGEIEIKLRDVQIKDICSSILDDTTSHTIDTLEQSLF